jgi:glycosyltransferase involved in cell wall biosynthesis
MSAIGMTDKKKSVLYIVPRINFFSEGSRGRVMHALGIAEGFAENGWKVMIVGGPGLCEFRADLPEETEFIEIRSRNGLLKKLRWAIELLFTYRSILAANRFDVLVVRYVILKYFLIWKFCLMAKRRSLATVLEVNAFAFHAQTNLPSFVKLAIAKLEVMMVNRYDILYTVSESMSRDPRINGCTSDIVAIANGATSKRTNFSNTVSPKESRVRFVYLGSLQEYWDFDIIVKAFRKFLGNSHDAQFHFYGSGSVEEYLKDISANEPRIVFHGRFRRRDLGILLNRKTDILVLPPKLQSDMALSGGLSTKLFDYLSLRMPIIAPAMGEINSVLKHKENALLYSHDSVESIIENVGILLEQPELRDSIAKNAYLDFIEKYTWRARMSILIERISEQKSTL